MRTLYLTFSTLIAAIFVLSGCSQKYLAQNSEVDDLYFTSKDRQALEASTKIYAENFTEEYDKPMTEDEIDEYADVNYSSRTINPEYIAKYSSEEMTEEEDLDSDGEYFDENYKNIPTESTDKYVIRNNYYGWSPYSSPYSVWNYSPYSVWNDPWYSPYWYTPYGNGLRVSVSFSYGWGASRFYGPNAWYQPTLYGSYGYGYYDPFFYGNYRYYDRYYSMYYGNPYYNPYYGNYYYGNYYSSYCPSYIAPSYFYSDSRITAMRQVTRGPRVTRNSSLPNTGYNNDQYRDSGDNNRIVDDGSVAVRDNSRTDTRSTGVRNNYYRRSGTRTSDPVATQNYQNYTNTRTRTGVSSLSNRTSTSGYSRTSQSSYYRTGNTGNTSRYSTGNGTRSTSSIYRSSGSTSRTSGYSRSSSSFNTGSSSRSSGTSSFSRGSSSSGSSRSSGSSSGSRSGGSTGGRRGGN